MSKDDAAGRRANLYLRSERAMGLESVPLTRVAAKAAQEPPTAKASGVKAPAQPARVQQNVAAVAVAAPAAGAADLLPVIQAMPFTSSILSREEKIARLKAMDDNEVKVCIRCRLSQTRTKTVFGEGDPDAKIFFIGEGPGETEDRTGRPFVGRAGELLGKMIGGMGLSREQVFIANIVKCRPPQNRPPAPDEVDFCTPYLVRQLEIVRPKVIVTLGLPSAKYMLNTKLGMGKIRGQWHAWRGIKLMPTFHPAYLLRAYTEENRAAVWSDLKAVMGEVGLTIPSKPRGG